jgi:hypothetical protein
VTKRIFAALIALCPTVALFGCAFDSADPEGDELVAQTPERVTGGTTGSGNGNTCPMQGCQKYSADKVNIKVSTNPDIYFRAAECSCNCPERGINNGVGVLRLDDPNAPSTFMCRNP